MITFKQFLTENYSLYGIYFVIKIGKEMKESEIIEALKKAVGHVEHVEVIQGLRATGNLKDQKSEIISDLTDDPELAAKVRDRLQVDKTYPFKHEVHIDMTVKGRPAHEASFEHPRLSIFYEEQLKKAFGYNAEILYGD